MTATDQLKRCGLGIRSIATIVDSFVWLALLFLAGFAVGIATDQIVWTAERIETDLEGTASLAALLLWLGLTLGYHTLLEWRYGKTLGKYLVDIQVRAVDGSRPTLWATFQRNVLRIVDFLPLYYLLGSLLVVITDDQRFGDKVAGTIVART